MDDELLAQRLNNLEREIVMLRQSMNDIKGMLAALSGRIDERAVTPSAGRKTIAEAYGYVGPD